MEPSRSPSAARLQLLALLAPVALAVAAYARSLHGEFLFDDLKGIAENGAIKAFWPWLRDGFLPEALAGGRPLTTLTFAANYAAGRLDPFGYHAVNLALHVAVVLLLWRLTLRVAAAAGAPRADWIALAVAGIFAVHPLESQAVSYVSQRAELLASALYVVTLLLLLDAGPADGRRPWGRWAAALLTFALGLAAKPIAVTVPVAWLALSLASPPAIPAHQLLPRPRASGGEGRGEGASAWRRRLPVLLPLAAVAGAFGIALLAALRGRPDAGFDVAGTSPWLYLLTQARALVVYLRLLAWPAGQRFDWGFPTSTGLWEPATLGAALAVLAIGAGAALLLVHGRRHATAGGAAARLAGLGLAWFFIVLAPTSSVVPLADNLVEHRVYLASWGVLLAAVAGAEALAARLGLRRAALVAWAAAVLLLGATLHRRNAVWESPEALWADVLEKDPHAARARMGIGHALEARGRTEEAIRQYEVALADAGRDPSLQAQLLRNLGSAHFGAGRLEEARAAFEAGLRLVPGNDELLVNLAFVESAAGDGAAAERLARDALVSNPRQPTAWILLGNLALARGEGATALAAFERAASLDPDRGDAHYNRGLALRMLGREAEACAATRAALSARLLPAERAVAESEAAARCP